MERIFIMDIVSGVSLSSNEDLTSSTVSSNDRLSTFFPITFVSIYEQSPRSGMLRRRATADRWAGHGAPA